MLVDIIGDERSGGDRAGVLMSSSRRASTGEALDL